MKKSIQPIDLYSTSRAVVNRAEYCRIMGISGMTAINWARKGVGPKPFTLDPATPRSPCFYAVNDIINYIEEMKAAAGHYDAPTQAD